MITLRENLVQVVLANVTRLNEENTEGELLMRISKELVEDKLKEGHLVVQALATENDTEQLVENGAYVYVEGTEENWNFDKYDTIADAVRAAVKLINAQVLYNGRVITYDTLNDDVAYYIDDEASKVKMVRM